MSPEELEDTKLDPLPEIAASNGELSKCFESETLFLSRRKLDDVGGILKNSTLKNLYLEGNRISNLPDSLFSSLPSLLWLDLRNNLIGSLPAGIGLHRSLNTLLLEGNPISELPPELGNVITLRALNLRNCPVRFPPRHVVHQGVRCILQYLRSVMAERPLSVPAPRPDMPPVDRLQLSELMKSSIELCEEEGEDELVDQEGLQRFRELKDRMIHMDMAALGRPFQRMKQGDRKPQLPLIKRKREIAKPSTVLRPLDLKCWKSLQERRLAATMGPKDKQAVQERRKKDQEILREWRTNAKVVQERKMLELEQKKREEQRAEEALEKTLHSLNFKPCAEDQSEASAAPATNPPQRKQRPLVSQKNQEEAREARERELELRIRTHVRMMQERHRKPAGTAEKQKAAAERDLKEAIKIQAELLERKRGKPMEYRFSAFTGDTSPELHDK